MIELSFSDEETADIAAAAGRAGMTAGEWVTRAVKIRLAVELPAELPDDVAGADPDDEGWQRVSLERERDEPTRTRAADDGGRLPGERARFERFEDCRSSR